MSHLHSFGILFLLISAILNWLLTQMEGSQNSIVLGLIYSPFSTRPWCPTSPVINSLSQQTCIAFWVSFLCIVSTALMLTTHPQAELLRLPHSLGRILIHHWIYITVPPALNIPQSFFNAKKALITSENTTHPILPLQTAKARISFPANKYSETS